MYFDAHCHLDHLSKDELSDYIISFAKDSGSGLVCIWTNLQDSLQNNQIYINTKSICKDSHISLGYTIGIHPWSVEKLDETHLEKLKNMIDQYLDKNSIGSLWLVGIWEIGTDLHYDIDKDIYDKQIYFFDKQCELASEYHLPIVVHSRDDFQGTLEIVKKYPDQRFYFHCWWYGTDELDILKSILHDNLRVGFCGNISYPKATTLRDSFKHARDHDIKILMETDAPYLSIQSLRWQPNHSKNIWLHYEYISSTFDIDKDYLINKVKQNYAWLYW